MFIHTLPGRCQRLEKINLGYTIVTPNSWSLIGRKVQTVTSNDNDYLGLPTCCL